LQRSSPRRSSNPLRSARAGEGALSARPRHQRGRLGQPASHCQSSSACSTSAELYDPDPPSLQAARHPAFLLTGPLNRHLRPPTAMGAMLFAGSAVVRSARPVTTSSRKPWSGQPQPRQGPTTAAAQGHRRRPCSPSPSPSRHGHACPPIVGLVHQGGQERRQAPSVPRSPGPRRSHDSARRRFGTRSVSPSACGGHKFF